MAGTGCCVVLLVAHLAGNAEGLDACGDRVEHLGRCFGKAGDRCLARHRVNGRFLWANALKRREPGGNVLLAGVVDELALILTGQKDRLDNNVTVKACERLNLVLDVVGANRLVEQLDKRRVDGIELKNVVVDHHERVVHLGTVGARAVGKHGDLGVWGKLVAQLDGAGDGLWKLRCGGGLAVACEGDHIGELALGCHLAQLCLERVEYHGSRVIRLMAGALGVEAVFAVNAVERADFAAGRHHVDAERETKATAANGPKDGAGIQKRRHRHMLLKTIVPKHSIGSKARCGLLLYKFRFFTSLMMPCHEKSRVGYS